MKTVFRPGKLLMTIVGRHQGDLVVHAGKEAGARGGTILMGRSITENKIMQLLAMADVTNDVVLTLVAEEADAVMQAISTAAQENPKHFKGMMLLIDVSGILRRVSETECNEEPVANRRDKNMNAKWELITVIVNNGYADDVMASARKAGATGGTIISGRGTGTEQDVAFFGISLVPEKEVLMILADKEKTGDILNAVKNLPNLTQQGGGIVFSIDVQEFIPLNL